MKVTRLEIFGFKSFLERFVLNFDKNMIGIVGPNGCGKSNVVDALRWVLGETQAKQLRGGSFEDLIFNGSETKRPLGMAEVSLTIQPESGWEEKVKAQSDLTDAVSEIDRIELELTKKTSGDEDTNSEVNSDETEVSQVDNNAKEEPLSIISKKIMEIPGIFDVAEIQFTRRLYRSGESEYYINKVPCRLRDLQDVYRLIGLGARGLSIVQQGQIGQFISRKPLERRELVEEAAGISGFRNKMEAATRRLDKTNDNLSRATDILGEVEKQVRSLKRQAQRAMARQSLKEELFKSDHDLFKFKSSRLVADLSKKEKEHTVLEAEIESHTASLHESDARITELEAQIHEVEAIILSFRRDKDNFSRSLMEQETRLQNIRVTLASFESESQHIQNRIDDSEKRKEVIQNEIFRLKDDYHALKEKHSAISTRITQKKESNAALRDEHKKKLQNFIDESQEILTSSNTSGSSSQTLNKINLINNDIQEKESLLQDVDNLHREANLHNAKLKDSEKQKIEVEKKITSIESEIRAINKQLDTYASHALEATAGSGSERLSNAKVLLSLIEVPKDYERALQAILGEKAEYLLSQDSASILDDFLREKITNSKKRVGVIDARNAPQLSSQNSSFFSIEGVIPAISVVKVNDEYSQVVSSILGDTYIAESLNSALKFKNELLESGNCSFSIVLVTGEVLTPWGWFSTHGEGVQFSFTRRLNELESQKALVEEDLALSIRTVTENEQSVRLIKSKIDSCNSIRNELHTLQKELSNLFKIKGEEERLQAEILRKKERELRDELQKIEIREASLLRGIEQEGMQLDSSLKNNQLQVDRLMLEVSSIETKSISLNDSLEEIKSKIGKSKEEVRIAQEHSFSESSQQLKESISAIEIKIEEHENQRVEFQKQLGQIRYEQSETRRGKDSVDRKIRSVISEVDRSRIELEMILENAQKQYPENELFVLPGEEEALSFVSHDEDTITKRINILRETSQSLRKKLEREGEVDPQSIELYEQEENRFASMTSQITDLRKAKETLERTIRQLKELSKIRFIETFKAVNEKFKELVPRLFAGGSGHLELLHPEDPLQSGVNIVVRPPGKKITTMELMSGGEKALVATAVLVAVFLHHPGPICVLDEVDAPLDDANLGRFLSLIREISDRTQFLVITHNKLTMQAVDRLIGITMQESGVTTAISVDLEESEEVIEKWAASA
jgi:chromosome segregation protein